MKKLFPIILTLCVALTFAACGNNQPDNSSCTHTFGDWTVERQATCKEEGLLTRTCTKCFQKEETKIEITNIHTETIDPEIPATCEKTGLSEGKHCSVCDTVLVAQQETPVVSHTYSDKYDESCNVCGHIRDAECAHKETEIMESREATCTEIGLTEGSKCKMCGEILINQTVISVIDHIAGDWIVDKEATAAENGEKHTECTMCGKLIEEESIPATGSIGLEYTLNADGESYAVAGIGTCKDFDVVIPAKYEGLPVTTIGDYAFDACPSLTSITIPDSITTIGKYAFNGCSGLIGITIPDSVTTIENRAFNKCISLADITIPDSVTTIGTHAFFGCTSLTSITIPDSVITIGMYAFYDCTSLTNVIIPDSVTAIGEYMFYKCTSLISVTIGDGATFIGSSTFYNCTSLTSVIIGNGVKSIGSCAFSHCKSLTSVTIPDSVTTISNDAFNSCTSLTSVTIPDSVTTIRTQAFYDCTSLTSVTIGNRVTTIEGRTFANCTSLTNVTIGRSVTAINQSAFSGCTSLASITSTGTMAQWNIIDFGKDWKKGVPATEVICSNGVVSLVD